MRNVAPGARRESSKANPAAWIWESTSQHRLPSLEPSPEVPISKAELDRGFDLALGHTCIAFCRVSVMAPPEDAEIIENDFIEAPHLGLRPAAQRCT
jgi:hypothetical protein